MGTDKTGPGANLHAIIGHNLAAGPALGGQVERVPRGNGASDPLALSLRDGKRFARGSRDTTGFLAACLAVPDFQVIAEAGPGCCVLAWERSRARLVSDFTSLGLLRDFGHADNCPETCIGPARRLAERLLV
jgi:hypothetical protein